MQECQCGRNRQQLHCPYCGYAGLSGQAKLTRQVDGVTIYSYRCRKCARVFDDLARELCKAPHIAEARYKKLADKVRDITGGKLPDWAVKLQKQRGVKTEPEPSVADEIDTAKPSEKE